MLSRFSKTDSKCLLYIFLMSINTRDVLITGRTTRTVETRIVYEYSLLNDS